MPKFDVASVSVNVAGRTATITDRQSTGSDPVKALAHLAELETPDGFRATLGVIEWPNAAVTVKLVDFMEGPDVYRRLERAGTLEIKIVNNQWVALIRALKYENKDYATLHGVSFAEIDELIKDDSKKILEDIQNVEVGIYGEFVPDAKRYQDAMAIRIQPQQIEGIAALYALTRVMPLMKNFGLRSVIGMD